MTRYLMLGLVALGLWCCGPRHSHVTVDTNVEVEIRIAPQPDELPFDPRGARLVAANHQLSSLVGHGLNFDIDAALVARWRSEFERQLIEGVEDLLRTLTALREDDPAEFSRTVRALRRIDCRYSVLVEYAHANFKGDTLLIELPGDSTRLISRGAVFTALHDRDLAWLDAHFDGVEPEAVAEPDAAAYFRWLSRSGFGYVWERRHPKPRDMSPVQEVTNDPQGDVIARIVRLHSKIESRDAALASEVRQWLLSQLSWLNWQYQGRAESLPLVGPETSMRQGERALCGWFERVLPRATAEERLHATDELFPPSGPLVCPNIDRFSFGLREADAWLKAGKPSEGGTSAEAKLMDWVVCPSVKGPDSKRERSLSCRPNWFLFALGGDANRRKLSLALDARDPELTEQLLASLEYSSTATAVDLIRLLDPHKPTLSAALAVTAEVWGLGNQSPLIQLAKDLWRQRPERRGDVLYIFARSEADYFWGKFQSEYSPINQADLERFLDHGISAFIHLAVMWPALGKGFSRVQPIVSHLGAILPDASQPSAAPSLRVLSDVVSRVCDEHSNAELAGLHAALEARANARPQERTALTILLHDTTAGACTSRKKINSTDEP